MASKDRNDRSLTAIVADFVADTGYDDIAADVLAVGKKNLLDTLACAISGSAAPGSAILRRYIEDMEAPSGGASVIGANLSLTPRFAALANGYSMHADDFDDTLQAATGSARSGRFGRMGVHPTGPVLAAVLATAEPQRRSGKEVLKAVLVGVEVACRVYDATDVDDIAIALHTTGSCGIVGAGAGLANLEGLGVEETRQVLSLAADQASGLLANFGTMAKAFHAGSAAERAIVAADLARMDFTASPNIMEAEGGYFQLEGGGFVEAPIVEKLGNPFSLVDRGIWLKPYPTGSLSHHAMTKFLDFVKEHDLGPDQVKAIRVRTSKGIRDTLHLHRPKTRLEAKFSLEFCLAALLIERRVGLVHFSDAFVNRPDVQENMAKVTYTAMTDAEFRTPGYSLVTSFVEIDLADGRTLSGRIDHGKGTKANPMTDEDVAEKVRLAAEYAEWPADRTAQAIDLVRNLDDVSDIGDLTACLSGGR